MLLRVASLLFIPLFLFALKIYSTSVNEKNGVYFLENPLIIYDNDSFIQAKKGIIEKNHIIKLYGNVNVFYKSKEIILADSLIAYSKKNIKFKEIFFYDKEIKGWVKAIEVKSRGNFLFFKKPYFSTCCINNPDWFIKATSGKYDRKAKVLKLHNIILIVYNVPIFYLPYLRVSFNKKRKSGFLRPYLGYSDKEGILYSQPIYFVTSINSDLEITPTIRTKRGRGVYSLFRFVDSPYSKGEIKAGVFKDNESFYKENNLAHKKHYGYSFYYKRDKFFKNTKLYINLKYANDVDYFYLDAHNYKFDTSYLTDKIITSKMNIIKENSNNFYGLYFKYFIDTSLLNNDTTWQILPQFNYHRFLEKRGFIFDAVDFNVYNYYRKRGSNFILEEINIPFSLYYYIFDDYIKLKLSETLYQGYGKYYQQDNLGISKYFYLTTQFRLFTSLAKKYNNFTHIINPSLSLNIKNYSSKKIYSDLIQTPDMQNYLLFNLFQIVNFNSLSVEHTMNNIYYLEEKKFGNLENLININYLNYSIDENNKYSFIKNKVIYNNIKFGYNNEKFDYFISHLYENKNLKTVTLGAGLRSNKYKKYYLEYSYDLINKYTKYWLVGVKLNKRCFKYEINFKQNRIPVLTNKGSSFRIDNMVYLSVEFYPIGGINQSFIFKGN